MKAIVTGAAGFIGSHLSEELLAQGHEVIGIDSLVTGRRENLKAIENHQKFSFIQEDILNLGDRKFDEGSVFFHLAALADIVPSVENPEKYHNANVTGTLRVLECARRSKAKRFLYAASSSCYGMQGKYPINEEHSCWPMYPYALTKYVAEQYVFHWSGLYGIQASSLRLFNVYGPRHRTAGSYGAMFGTWLAQMANGHAITIVGDGTQTRDFIYVTDVARAFVVAAQADYTGVFNIGSGETFTIRMIADFLEAKERVYIPKRPGEPGCTWAKITRARTKLKWKPRVEVRDGVKVLLSHLNEYKHAPLWTPEKIEVATKSWFEHLGG